MESDDAMHTGFVRFCNSLRSPLRFGRPFSLRKPTMERELVQEIDFHVTEQVSDENTIILKVEITDAVLISHGTRYERYTTNE